MELLLTSNDVTMGDVFCSLLLLLAHDARHATASHYINLIPMFACMSESVSISAIAIFYEVEVTEALQSDV